MQPQEPERFSLLSQARYCKDRFRLGTYLTEFPSVDRHPHKFKDPAFCGNSGFMAARAAVRFLVVAGSLPRAKFHSPLTGKGPKTHFRLQHSVDGLLQHSFPDNTCNIAGRHISSAGRRYRVGS